MENRVEPALVTRQGVTHIVSASTKVTELADGTYGFTVMAVEPPDKASIDAHAAALEQQGVTVTRSVLTTDSTVWQAGGGKTFDTATSGSRDMLGSSAYGVRPNEGAKPFVPPSIASAAPSTGSASAGPTGKLTAAQAAALGSELDQAAADHCLAVLRARPRCGNGPDSRRHRLLVSSV